MKKTLVLGAAALAATLVAVSTAEAERNLIYSTYLPASHSLVAKAVIPYYERVEADSGGSLHFEVSAGGALAGAKETLTALEGKAIDAGFVVDSYNATALPESAMLVDLALLVSDPLVITGAMNETILRDCPECLARFTASNVKPIAIISSTPYRLLCKPEIRTLADLQGKKIRSTSSWAIWANTLGAVAVNIPSGETYEALQRGQVDCTFGYIGQLRNYSLQDVVENITDLPVGTFYGSQFLNIRADLWEELNEQERRALIANAAEAITDGLAGYFAAETDGEQLIQETGINLVEPADDLLEAHRALKPKEIERISATAKERGTIEDPDAVIAIFTANLEKWEGIVAETGGDLDLYRAALQREIYDGLLP